MTYWTYVEPGDDGRPNNVTVSEKEIIDTFYPWWCRQMRRVHKVR